MFNIVLVEPEIPQNTGNIARTCAATGCRLHLAGKLGFELSDKYLKRAGLDYWQFVDVKTWKSFDELVEAYPGGNYYFFTTKAKKCYTDAKYCEGDFLVFGKETKGLPEDFLQAHYDSCVRIPMRSDARSLNLSNAVAVTVFEALRQLSFPGLQDYGKMRG